MTPGSPLPDPALVVLIGASGSGKSTWAAEHYRAQEIVSSDDLRGIVGSGRHDLDASKDAFALLDQIVAARLKRGLTTVVDTLGLDADRRLGFLALARAAKLPGVAVVFDTPAALCRERNASRDRPVPANALNQQLKKARGIAVGHEGWDVVETVATTHSTREPVTATVEVRPARHDGEIILQVSRFPWGEDPAGWLKSIALAADEAGFAGIAMMDHLIQIPQVDRAWEPMPEPFVVLGMLAGLDTKLRLGTLCTPVTFRPGGVLAKTIATLDVLTDGRSFVGIGAGWFEREHAAYGLDFPPPSTRLDTLETSIETMRALWAKGTKAYDGQRISLPETTCYPRPVGEPQIIVGGSGHRSLLIAATLGDACNIHIGQLDTRLPVFERLRAGSGRDTQVSVLDAPIIGRDRDDVWNKVEFLRGNVKARAFAERHHAATAEETRERYAGLVERGVNTIFVALTDLAGPDDVLALAPLTKPL